MKLLTRTAYFVIITVHIFIWTSTEIAYAGNTGALTATTNAAVTTLAGDNNGFETTPTNTTSNNTAYAISTNSGSLTSTSCALPNTGSDQHIFGSFGVSIPTNSKVTGIGVAVDAKYDSGTGTNTVCVLLSYDGGTTWTTGQNTGDIGTTDVLTNLGGSTNLWGKASWSSTELNNTNFKVLVMSLVANTARDLSLDYLAVTVYYNELPATPTQNAPTNGATGQSVTPTFTMTTTDPDSDKLGYRVEIYSNVGCTTVVQTNTQAVSSTGWTGTDTSCTANPTSCYTSGTQGSYATQSALSGGTQYWWKAAAFDPDGSGNYATSTTCNSFTTSSNSLPTASSVSVDSGASSITLTEGTTKSVSCVGTVTDTDGYTNISSVKADFFRTSVGIGSALDDNDHYRLSGDSQCVPSGGSGNSETYTCAFSIQYFADATDAGSPNSSDTWTCTMTPTDSVGDGTTASDTIEMDSLIALDVTSSISYGSVNPNSDTGASNQSVTVTNTGNRDMDPQISGTTMSSGGDTIAVGQQKYFGSSFTYASSGTALSTTPTAINLTLPQRTSGAVTATVYWGIGIPNGTPAKSYTGTNTFTAAAGI
jgi:hypothetical protein